MKTNDFTKAEKSQMFRLFLEILIQRGYNIEIYLFKPRCRFNWDYINNQLENDLPDFI